MSDGLSAAAGSFQPAQTPFTYVPVQLLVPLQENTDLKVKFEALQKEHNDLKSVVGNLQKESSELKTKLAVVEAQSTGALVPSEIPKLVIDGNFDKADFIVWYAKLQPTLKSITFLSGIEQFNFIFGLFIERCGCGYCCDGLIASNCQWATEARHQPIKDELSVSQGQIDDCPDLLQQRLKSIGVQVFDISFSS